MRRYEKSLQENEILDRIITKAQICHLACCLDDQPYLIPISFGYDGNTVYFHTAKTGKKVDIWMKNPQVILGFETDINLVTDLDKACEWTFHYQSVIATGVIKEIIDPTGKRAGLNHIMRHYSGKEWDLPDREISKTNIWGVELETITGKRSPANK